MKRYGMVIGLRPEKVEEYDRLHAAVWPDVLKMIAVQHPQLLDLPAALPDGRHYLFSYFEYTGNDFAADMAKMAADPATQRWWAVCKPCQSRLPPRPGRVVGAMEEVFHQD